MSYHDSFVSQDGQKKTGLKEGRLQLEKSLGSEGGETALPGPKSGRHLHPLQGIPPSRYDRRAAGNGFETQDTSLCPSPLCQLNIRRIMPFFYPPDFIPTWITAIPLVIRLYSTCSNPISSRIRASSSGSGNIRMVSDRQA